MGSNFSASAFPKTASCQTLYPDRATNIVLTLNEDREKTSIIIIFNNNKSDNATIAAI